MKEIQYIGVWWLPEAPDNKVSGSLSIVYGDGIFLTLSESFNKDNVTDNELKAFNPTIILGKSINNTEITLYNCYEIVPYLDSIGMPTKLYCETAFIGVHFSKEEDIKFIDLTFKCTYLDDWLKIAAVELEDVSKDEIIVKFKNPKPIKVKIDDFTIIFKSKFQLGGLFEAKEDEFLNIEEIKVYPKKFIIIRSSNERHFTDFLKMISHLLRFISLGLNYPVYLQEIKGISEVKMEKVGKKTYRIEPIQIFHNVAKFHQEFISLNEVDFLFTCADIKNSLEKILQNWFKNSKLFERVYNAYFEMFYNKQVSLEHKFLGLIKALEIYHDYKRKVNDSNSFNVLSENKWNKVKNEIVKLINNMLSKNEANILITNLDCLNRFALQEKLKYLLSNCLGKHLKELNEVIDEFITDENEFIEKVVMIGNMLSDSTNENILYDKPIKKNELANVILNLKRLLEICKLKDLGFSFDMIKNIYSKRSIKDLKRQLKEMEAELMNDQNVFRKS
ncbi:MAG: hypothetical protein PWP68_1464 [Rikenellaceae bacterium]|nr:hypothetical protein [Rikenellaceae bacterium]